MLDARVVTTMGDIASPANLLQQGAYQYAPKRVGDDMYLPAGSLIDELNGISQVVGDILKSRISAPAEFETGKSTFRCFQGVYKLWEHSPCIVTAA